MGNLPLLAHEAARTKKQLDHYGLTVLIGQEHFYDNLAEVLEAYQKETNRTSEEPAGEENIIN